MTIDITPLATPAYVPLDPNAPAGATQAPDTYAASDLANVRGLRDAIVCGFVPSYAYSQSGGSNAAPTYRVWNSGSIAFRLQTVQYDATIAYLPLQIKWQWSNDNGATWVDMDATATVLTWDTATSLKLLTVSRDAGLWCMALQAVVGQIYAGNNIAIHTGLTGNAVHGLGTMSTQNAASVNITGGSLGPVIIGGGSQYNNSSVQAATRIYPANPPTITSGADWDWSTTPTQCQAVYPPPNPFQIAGIKNFQPGEMKRLYAYGIVAINIGKPTAAYADIYWTPGMAFNPALNILSFVAVNAGAVAVSLVVATGPSATPT
jgi:hypothetical protein